MEKTHLTSLEKSNHCYLKPTFAKVPVQLDRKISVSGSRAMENY